MKGICGVLICILLIPWNIGALSYQLPGPAYTVYYNSVDGIVSLDNGLEYFHDASGKLSFPARIVKNLGEE